MSDRTTIPIELLDFQRQKLPTLQQTTQNNHSILVKRKKFFLTDLKESIQFLEIFLIILIYLRDISFFKLLIRTTIHLSIININPSIISRMTNIPEDYKKSLTKVALRGVILGNLFCMFWHLIFGIQNGDKNISGNEYLYGGITIQFIGDRVPFNRFEVILLDLLVFITQLIFHNLFSVINDDDILQINQTSQVEVAEDDERVYDEGDGYNGNVQLLTIDILGNIRKVMSYKINLQPINMNNEGTQMPGAFPNPRLFV